MRLPRPLARAVKRERCSLVDVDALDLAVDISAFVVLRIRDCRQHNLLHDASRLLRRERQNVQRLVDRQTADLVSHKARFLRRDAGTAMNAFTSILIAPYFLAFLSAA